VVLVRLTGVIWITAGLRGIDLMTSQGQTIITFLASPVWSFRRLVLIISPIALMIAISHTLNKLATDSEIIVMKAAGLSPFAGLFRPFLYATWLAIMVAFIASYLAPDGMRRLKSNGCRNHRDVAGQYPAARPLRSARSKPDDSAFRNGNRAAYLSHFVDDRAIPRNVSASLPTMERS